MDKSLGNYPSPDRSDFQPNQFKDDEEMPEKNLGFQTGVLPDGRPFHCELWAQEGATLITYFFSTIGLEKATTKTLLKLLTKELKYQGVPLKYRQLDEDEIEVFQDASENSMYSLTFVVGISD